VPREALPPVEALAYALFDSLRVIAARRFARTDHREQFAPARLAGVEFADERLEVAAHNDGAREVGNRALDGLERDACHPP